MNRKKSQNPGKRKADIMEDYIKKRIAELELRKQQMIETANQAMADASAAEGGIFELQCVLEEMSKDKTEAAE